MDMGRRYHFPACDPDGYYYTPAGIYGTEGMPSITNLPGMRSGAIGLTDSSGKFWLFGGVGVDKGNGVDTDLARAP